MQIPLLNTLRFLNNHPIASGRRLETLTRYVRWQVGSRLVPGPVVVDFVNDARLLIRRGMAGATGNVYAGLHEFADMAFVLHVLRENDLFVDAGANIGSYTVLAAKSVGAHVISFEPVASSYSTLMDNVRLNGIESLVSARAVCVGGTNGTATVTSDLDSVNHVVTGQVDGRNHAQVPVVRLDDELGSTIPTALKLDVEGYEWEVLQGAPRLLANPALKALVLELNGSGERYGHPDTELAALLRSHGFQSYVYDPFKRRLIDTETLANDGNVIFVRDREFVQSRLRTAPAFRVLGRNI